VLAGLRRAPVSFVDKSTAEDRDRMLEEMKEITLFHYFSFILHRSLG